ncbi:ATP synthase subunit I [Comamonadaceae bacterium G21597-S1]|nr:ATP synthase subunit I [Comamonadaceae bacterium G21597-S1]
MIDAWMLLGVLAIGMVLGLVFFGGLWWTLRRGLASAHPVRWFVSSLLVRAAVVLGGIYWVGAGQWQRLLACLLGFWLARLLVLRLTREPAPPRPESEVAHAP